MTRRPTLLLLIPHLGGGGAERVFELLALHLPAEKYELHLGLVTESGEARHGLPASVTIHYLGTRRVRGGIGKILRLVRRLRPDVVLSNMAHLNFVTLLLRPLFPGQTRLLVRQNGTVSMMLADMRRPATTRMLYKWLYPQADAVICQTTAMACDLAHHARVPRHRIAVAPNPVDVNAIRTSRLEADAHWNGPGPHLLAVGRLVPQKGFDLLLEAFARLRQRFPTADLTLAGAGSEEANLRQQAHMLGLDCAVQFLGYTRRPAAHYGGASIFVLSSRQEGLPNALLEAAAGGLPIVTTPASAGVVELVNNKPGVWMADETSAAALERAMVAALTTITPGQRFGHDWIEPFGLEQAVARFEAVIDEALAATKRGDRA